MGFYDTHPELKAQFSGSGSGGAPATSQASTSDPYGFNSLAQSLKASMTQAQPSMDAPDMPSQPQPPTERFQSIDNPWGNGPSDVAIPAGMRMQSNPWSISGSGGMGYSEGGPVGYDTGGAVDDDSDSGNEPDNDLDDALQAVQAAFDYGKQKHGLGGQQQASAIPSAPGGQSESGAPRPLPMPGPLPPTSNPFGKRNNPFPAGKTASAIPMVPGNPSDSGIPRPLPEPGPLPPTSNPFGKRTNPPPRGLSQAEPEDTEDEAA